MKKVLDHNELSLVINKINLNIKDEKEAFNKFSLNLIDLENYYKTNNELILQELNNKINIKAKMFEQIHDNYVAVLNSIMNQYENASIKSENILKDI